MIRTIRHFIRRQTKASVAVEFALMSVLMLLPLLACTTDLVIVLAARAQLNITQQALYYFAQTNTAVASNPTDVGDIVSLINQSAYFPVSLAAAPNLTYVCYTTQSTAPTFSAPSSSSSACTGTQTTETFVNYQLTLTVNLPIIFPAIPSTYTMAANGSIQIPP